MSTPSRRSRTAERSLDGYATDWEANARADACFAILSDPEHLDGAWDLDVFLGTGEAEIAAFFAELARLDLHPDLSGRALDFGCGVGRLTAALGRRFTEAVGVDVAPTMVERARAVHAGSACTFVCNQRDDLAVFADGAFAFVYSNIVLQHLTASLQRGYVRELVRVTAPGGLAAFQIPSRRRGWQGTARRVLPEPVVRALRGARRPPAALRGEGYALRMEMHCLPESEVRALVESVGGEVVAVRYTNAAEPDFGGRFVFTDAAGAWARAAGGGYVSPHYVVRRR